MTLRALDRDARLVPGDTIAKRYRVERVIGRGGMGHVVAARDAAGRAVAVKVLRPVPIANARLNRRDAERAWRRRFALEGKILASTSSPHLVTVREISDANEATPWVVMEQLVGSDLSKVLADGETFGQCAVADIVIQTCAALACLHGAGIVHRDIKPANLFAHAVADGACILKVLDLGIAKHVGCPEGDDTSPSCGALATETPLSVTSTRDGMLGTPAYMSPEHVRDPRRVDHRSDLWALGVVAYQLVTGMLPFDGRSIGEIFVAAIRGECVPLASFTSLVSPDFGRAVDACLQIDPAARPQSASALARALAPFASASWARAAFDIPETRTVTATATRHASEPQTLAPSARVDGRTATLTLPGDGRSSGIFSSDRSAPLALVR